MDNKKESKFKSFTNKYTPIMKYILRRILYLIPVALVISFIIYWIVDLMPGNPVMGMIDPEKPLGSVNIAEIEEQLGLNQPFIVRYFKWLGNVLRGDLGYAQFVSKAPVGELIKSRMWNTFSLNLIAFVISLALSIVIGVKSAVDRYSPFDNFFTVFSLFGISMPSFFIAMILLFVFSINLGWLPFTGMRSPTLPSDASFWVRTWDLIKHMIMPTLVLVLGNMAGMVRYIKNAMLDVLRMDFIRTAKSKGLTDKVVIYRHAFRNALIPIVTMVSAQIAGMFGGNMILEKVFVWPGLGGLLNDSYSKRDTQVMMALLVFYAMMNLMSNLLADVAYGIVDPRIRLGGGSDE